MSIILTFAVVSTNGNHIYLEASPDLLTGTDTACELYWSELDSWLDNWNYVHITNQPWIPGPRAVALDPTAPDDPEPQVQTLAKH